MAPHIHEKIDFTAEVFVVHKNKVLLRMHDKLGFWLSVGGHIELDEDPNEAAVREVKEEVGLDVILVDTRQLYRETPEDGPYRELIPPVFMSRTAITATSGHEHIVLTYFAISESDDVRVQHDDDRSDDWEWVTREELRTMDLRPNVRFYAERALDELRS